MFLRTRAFALVLLSSFVVSCSSTPTTKPEDLVAVTILHTNDVHGHVWPVKNKEGVVKGGFASHMAVIKKIREEVEANKGVVLLLSGGDVNTGYPESDILDGEPDITSMNKLGYDAMVLGNHDFDDGINEVRRQQKWAKFPMITANVSYADGKQALAEPYAMIEKGGVKFGILGLTTDSLKNVVLSDHVKNFSVISPIASAKRFYPEMKAKGADLVIALTHVGINHAGKRPDLAIATDDTSLAQSVPELNAIVGGHSHELLKDGMVVNGVPIVQAGEKGEHLGRLDLVWDKQKQKVVSHKASVIPINPSLGEDPEIKAHLDSFQTRVSKELDENIATATVTLDGDRDNIRHKETNFGNLICDSLLKVERGDVCIMNGGGIRGSVGAGPVTRRDMYRVFPFKNTVTTAMITGAQLKEAVENGLRYQNSSGSFLQIGGFRFSAKGEVVNKLEFKGKPIKDDSKLKLVTSNFLMEGGDNQAGLPRVATIKNTGIPIEAALMKVFKSIGKLSPKVDGRIQTLP